ncbi:UDP-N-acetylmuramoyl-L-alanyl-D-glutamate--2,6-diaminopimelate ligase [Acaryochloris sp. IP29b_bin.137]|uniref:UDP-N-acetylmuramoyl-L-alanyl-D-glutamate--2, 6-diaminopimelate ligase n=1 Tax=Acaryochloris sp. IP29b_bin.137 TaxID=2969217 RepID=UPI00260F39CC|nr:UDP-N-acetylmuramoyl-L-alanyl-D-glutamate--2,6-diaminopimelate ligase [Acaryochloris sp. IP29b_bin.137]
MVKLRALLAELSANLWTHPEQTEHPALDQDITGLTTNSWAVQPGNLFIGMPGTRVDGGNFWKSALDAGAVAALVSDQVDVTNRDAACVIPLQDMPQACAEVAAAFYGHPSQKLKLVGMTGTNGKTTTTHLIEYLLTAAQYPTALFGTLYARWPGHQSTAMHTTPFAVDLQQQLAAAAAADCKFGVMEVSSHALAQQRVLGCKFAVAVFSNLTQDHLDYHRDMEDYFAAKALLFSPEYLKGRAVINIDDPYGQRLADQLAPDQCWTYSIDNADADIYTRELCYETAGVKGQLHTPLGSGTFFSPLVGQFNVSNLLAGVGAALTLDLTLEHIIPALAQFPGVPGRMQQIMSSSEQDISVIVDYAHTPDSLENLLKAARPFVKGQMICVFGCGGDRDRTKRPLMGEIAARLADQAIVTSDNPRTEDPQQILQDVLAGIPTEVHPIVEVDRRVAIQTAIAQAKPGDTILIAGKGHEDYQILGTEKIHFDDREEAQTALAQRYG